MIISRVLVVSAILCVVFPCMGVGPLIIADQVVPGCNGSIPTLTITLNTVTHNYYANGLYYHFDPPSPGVLPSTGGNPLILQIPASFTAGSNHVVWISTSAAPTGGSSSSNYPFAVPSCRKGMTWSLLATNPTTGTIKVGCGTTCDPRKGDTPCTQPLPLLCIKKSGTGFPLPLPQNVNNSDQYNKWSGGVVATTTPIPAPTSLSAADTACSNDLGLNWRVAEFHDGWGWSFQSYGGVGNPAQRFWVHINDQPGGTCW